MDGSINNQEGQAMKYTEDEKVRYNKDVERLARWLRALKVGRYNEEVCDKFGWDKPYLRELREYYNAERPDLQIMSDIDGKGYRICRTHWDLFSKVDHSLQSGNGMAENEMDFVAVFRELHPDEWSPRLEQAIDCFKMWRYAYDRYQDELKVVIS
jgi:hypothetical protein